MKMAQTLHLTMDHEDLSYHTVPCTPHLGKRPAVCESPAATVPDVDITNCRQPIFVILNASPHPSSSTNRVPSISPKTPVMARNTNYRNARQKEQLVPSQSPFVRTAPVISTIEKITGNNGRCLERLHLFSDDDSIFL